MWWHARTEAEEFLQREAERLRTGYRELVRGPSGTVLRGVGAGAASPSATPTVPIADQLGFRPGSAVVAPLDLAQGWYPLVLADASAMQALPEGVIRIPWQDVDPGSGVAQDLRVLQPSPGTLVEPVGPLAAAVSPGCTTAAVGIGTATVGLPVTIVAPHLAAATPEGFLTVAHGVPGRHSAVTVGTTAGVAVSGTVEFWEEGARGTAGGDDIALVTLAQGRLAGWVPNSGVHPAPNGPPYSAEAVDLFAGQSGRVLAQVNGALLQMGDAAWQWLDCWELGATTPGMRHGDSGALAVGPTAPHPVYGHFVGGAIALRGAGFTHHWVQDLGQVLVRQPALSQMIAF